MQTRKSVSLVDVSERVIANSGGMREKFVDRARTYILDVGIVGQNTYWSAAASNTILSYSIKIRAILFNNEKWCYFDNKVYEIINIGKTQNSSYILLNVKENNDSEIKKAIELWENRFE